MIWMSYKNLTKHFSMFRGFCFCFSTPNHKKSTIGKAKQQKKYEKLDTKRNKCFLRFVQLWLARNSFGNIISLGNFIRKWNGKLKHFFSTLKWRNFIYKMENRNFYDDKIYHSLPHCSLRSVYGHFSIFSFSSNSKNFYWFETSCGVYFPIVQDVSVTNSCRGFGACFSVVSSNYLTLRW